MKGLQKDHTGKTYGELKVLAFNGRDKHGGALWLCECFGCGVVVVVRMSQLRRGRAQCLCTEDRRKTHGHTGSRTWRSWASMIQRCYTQQTTSYKYYGARGITVCSEWKESFQAFLDDMGERPKGMTLDRIDNDGNYEKNNCRWATVQMQNENSSNAVHITYQGKTKTIKAWSRALGINYGTLWDRINSGVPVEIAFTEPTIRNTHKFERIR